MVQLVCYLRTRYHYFPLSEKNLPTRKRVKKPQVTFIATTAQLQQHYHAKQIARHLKFRQIQRQRRRRRRCRRRRFISSKLLLRNLGGIFWAGWAEGCGGSGPQPGRVLSSQWKSPLDRFAKGYFFQVGCLGLAHHPSSFDDARKLLMKRFWAKKFVR